MLANRTSRWSLGTALLCIILLAVSWFLLISPRRADAAQVREQTVQADNQADMLTLQIAELKSEFADLPARQAELKAIKRQLPPKANMPALVRDLQSLAGQAGVSLDSVTPGTPAILAEPGVVAPTTAEAGSVVGVPMAVVITGDYFEASLFIKNLQTKLERSYLITGLAMTPGEVEVTTAPVPAVGPTNSATPTAVTPEVIVTPEAEVEDLSFVQLSLNGSIFVLMDGTSTLEDIKREAEAAAAAGTAKATPTTAPTASAGAATN